MVELADTRDLGSRASRRAGSSPASRTISYSRTQSTIRPYISVLFEAKSGGTHSLGHVSKRVALRAQM